MSVEPAATMTAVATDGTRTTRLDSWRRPRVPRLPEPGFTAAAGGPLAGDLMPSSGGGA